MCIKYKRKQIRVGGMSYNVDVFSPKALRMASQPECSHYYYWRPLSSRDLQVFVTQRPLLQKLS
jgi:hypothetical protein